MILAWVLPFLVVAGGWMYYLTHHRTRQRATEEADTAVPESLPAEYVERLERELEQFE